MIRREGFGSEKRNNTIVVIRNGKDVSMECSKWFEKTSQLRQIPRKCRAQQGLNCRNKRDFLLLALRYRILECEERLEFDGGIVDQANEMKWNEIK